MQEMSVKIQNSKNRELLEKIANGFDLVANHELTPKELAIANMLCENGNLVSSYFPERTETIYALPPKK
jgi:hypothetical protein